MNTITVTSQGQITLPAKVRRALNIKGSDQLQYRFDAERRQVVLEKPMTLEQFMDFTKTITQKIPKNIQPIAVDTIHEFYEAERAAEIATRMKEN